MRVQRPGQDDLLLPEKSLSEFFSMDEKLRQMALDSEVCCVYTARPLFPSLLKQLLDISEIPTSIDQAIEKPDIDEKCGIVERRSELEDYMQKLCRLTSLLGNLILNWVHTKLGILAAPSRSSRKQMRSVCLQQVIFKWTHRRCHTIDDNILVVWSTDTTATQEADQQLERHGTQSKSRHRREKGEKHASKHSKTDRNEKHRSGKEQRSRSRSRSRSGK